MTKFSYDKTLCPEADNSHEAGLKIELQIDPNRNMNRNKLPLKNRYG